MFKIIYWIARFFYLMFLNDIALPFEKKIFKTLKFSLDT